MGRREADRTFGADGLRPFTPWMGRCEASGTVVTGNQEYIKIGNEATSKIATIVHQKR